MNPPHSIHWGYGGSAAGGNNSSSTWVSVPARPVKRPLSVSESDDCDDAFSEESSKEQCTSPGDADSCQMLSRKKRRGVIEKKRRDRINTSLTELKRLVPTAFEKQGSAKLEKAEILQMTVDHLKMIHSKGLDALTYDPHKFAMDYHNIGFRECATEVARYLVTIEGMDLQDPLRLRLLSHLQCFVTQREIASKHTSSGPPWGYAPSSQPFTQSVNPIPTSSSSVSAGIVPNLSHQAPLAPSLTHHSNLHDLNAQFDISTSCAQSTAVPTSSDVLSRQPSSTILTPLTPVSAVSTTAGSAFGYHHQYSNLNPFSSASNQQHPNYNQGSSSQMKPYRPWGGAEVAY